MHKDDDLHPDKDFEATQTSPVDEHLRLGDVSTLEGEPNGSGLISADATLANTLEMNTYSAACSVGAFSDDVLTTGCGDGDREKWHNFILRLRKGSGPKPVSHFQKTSRTTTKKRYGDGPAPKPPRCKRTGANEEKQRKV